MAKYGYRNEEYRDELIKSPYPFDEESTLSNGQINIGKDLFLDAILYFKQSITLPVHISEIDGTADDRANFNVILADSTGTIVARATINQGEEKAFVIDNNGLNIGFLVVTEDGFNRFSGDVSGKVFHLLDSVARFSLDVCSVSTVDHVRAIVASSAAANGNVDIVARHGVRWTMLDNGNISLDVVGDPPVTDGVALVSVNGVSNETIWLNHHPELNLRIAVINGVLTFTLAKDDT